MPATRLSKPSPRSRRSWRDSCDGENIGNATGRRYNIRDRDHFQRLLAGEQFAVGDPVKVDDIRWVFPVARAVRNAAGELQAVLIVGAMAMTQIYPTRARENARPA